MPLGPLRAVCVRPAPKSRFVVFEPSRQKIKIKIKCRSRASRLKPVLQGRGVSAYGLIVPSLRVGMYPVTLRVTSPNWTRVVCRTQSVRGGVTTRSVGTIRKSGGDLHCRTGFSREALDLLLIFEHKNPKHRLSRLWCRLNGGFAEWAERHGCRESRPPPWMAAGPRCGTGVKEPDEVGPNREQAPLVTWGAFQK